MMLTLLATTALPRSICVTGPLVEVRPTFMPGALIEPVTLIPPTPVTSRLPPTAMLVPPTATEPSSLRLVARVLVKANDAALVLPVLVSVTSPRDAPATTVMFLRPKLIRPGAPAPCTRL